MLKTIWNFAKGAFGKLVKLVAKSFIWLGSKLGLCGAGAAVATAAVATEVAVESATEVAVETAAQTATETAVETTTEFICGLLG